MCGASDTGERANDARQRYQVTIAGIRLSGDGFLESAKCRHVTAVLGLGSCVGN